jgi:hypothetical protein
MVPRGGSARADEVVDPAGLIGSWHNNAGLGQSTLRSHREQRPNANLHAPAAHEPHFDQVRQN